MPKIKNGIVYDMYLSRAQTGNSSSKKPILPITTPFYTSASQSQTPVYEHKSTNPDNEVIPVQVRPPLMQSEKKQESQPTETKTTTTTKKSSTLSVPSTKQTTSEMNPTVTINSRNGRAPYWMQQFTNLGISLPQQLAILAAMSTECNLKPFGAVNKKEFEGRGRTKPGWAHAGEGSIGFTHWKTKKKFIEMYNADPRREGPKLSTDESEYAKNESRHIADLSDKDHALITYLYYKPLIDKTQGMNFADTVASFYIQKAAPGWAKDAGSDIPYDQAVYIGNRYQKIHEEDGYIKASKTNSFLSSLAYARNLAKQFGITL